MSFNKFLFGKDGFVEPILIPCDPIRDKLTQDKMKFASLSFFYFQSGNSNKFDFLLENKKGLTMSDLHFACGKRGIIFNDPV